MRFLPRAVRPSRTARSTRTRSSVSPPEFSPRVCRRLSRLANGDLTITFNGSGGVQGVLQLGAQTAGGQTAEQIVDAEVNNIANGAQLAYVIPGSMIGYQQGFGAAYNFNSNSSDGQTSTVRLIVLAAIRDNIAVVSVCYGPLQPFGDGQGQYNDDHPSIADLEIAQAGDPVIDSVLWPGQTTP